MTAQQWFLLRCLVIYILRWFVCFLTIFDYNIYTVSTQYVCKIYTFSCHNLKKKIFFPDAFIWSVLRSSFSAIFTEKLIHLQSHYTFFICYTVDIPSVFINLLLFPQYDASSNAQWSLIINGKARIVIHKLIFSQHHIPVELLSNYYTIRFSPVWNRYRSVSPCIIGFQVLFMTPVGVLQLNSIPQYLKQSTERPWERHTSLLWLLITNFFSITRFLFSHALAFYLTQKLPLITHVNLYIT